MIIYNTTKLQNKTANKVNDYLTLHTSANHEQLQVQQGSQFRTLTTVKPLWQKLLPRNII